jgi:hypothetical protein
MRDTRHTFSPGIEGGHHLSRGGIGLSRTTAYHLAANGLVERFHRTLKAAIMCRADQEVGVGCDRARIVTCQQTATSIRTWASVAHVGFPHRHMSHVEIVSVLLT